MKQRFRFVSFLFFFAYLAGAEAHFALAPKVAVEPLPLPQPEATLFRAGSTSASRGDFSDYLLRLTAFETKYQRVQPNFSAHFNLLQGVAFFHPENVHTYIDKVAPVRDNPALYQFAVKQWIRGQIGIYARLMGLLQEARKNGLEQIPQVAATLDFYAAGVKTALLEELIVLGDMEPSVEGIGAVLRGKDPRVSRLIERGARGDTELQSPQEQRRLKDRWRRFRHDRLRSLHPVNRCASGAESSRPDEDLVVLELGRRRITLAQYHAVFGRPVGERHRRGQMRGNCSRMILFYAMADLVDELGILPARSRKDIRTSHAIYLMALQLVREAAGELLQEGGSAPRSLKVAEQLMRHPKVIEVKDWLLAKEAPGHDDAPDGFLDQDLIEGTEWSLERVLAPKHSIHM